MDKEDRIRIIILSYYAPMFCEGIGQNKVVMFAYPIVNFMRRTSRVRYEQDKVTQQFFFFYFSLLLATFSSFFLFFPHGSTCCLVTLTTASSAEILRYHTTPSAVTTQFFFPSATQHCLQLSPPLLPGALHHYIRYSLQHTFYCCHHSIPSTISLT